MPHENQKFVSFAHLNLLESLEAYLKSEDIHAPTFIQNQSIWHVLNKTENLFIGSSTGSGKTLAYLLPIFQLFKEEEIRLSGEADHFEDVEIDMSLPYHFQYLDKKEQEEWLAQRDKEVEKLKNERKQKLGKFHPNAMKVTLANRPRVVIVVPSKELVQQVTDVAKDIGNFCKLGVLGL